MAQNQQVPGQASNQQLQQRQAALASLLQQNPYKQLVKAEQLTQNNFGSILDSAKIESYRQGVQGFWQTLATEDRNSERHKEALGRLAKLSSNLFTALNQRRDQSGQNQTEQQPPPNAGRNQQQPAVTNNFLPNQQQIQQPQPQQPAQNPQQAQRSQQGQQDQQQQGQPPQQSQQSQQPQQAMQQMQQMQQQNPNPQAPRQQQPAANQGPDPAMFEECKKEAAKLDWVGPSDMTPGSEQARQWIAAAQESYAKGLLRVKMAAQKMKDLQGWAAARVTKGEDRNVVQKDFDGHRQKINKQHAEGKQIIAEFAQKGIRGGVQGVHDAGQAPSQQQQPANSQQISGNSNQQQVGGNLAGARPPPSGQAPMMQRPAQGVNQGANANFSQQNPQSATNQQNTRPQPGPVQSPQQRVPNAQSGSNDAPKYDLDQAMQARAQSYTAAPQGSRQTSQQNANPRTSTGEFSGGPQRNNGNTWVPPAPPPVEMPKSRPTLGGPNGGPNGPMGQPAIQKPDTFLLQGPGDRVLDRKKLDELTRQIMGADAADGDLLTPEVAESALQLADEFVENVVTSACKLAKLRGATTLEIRDIQLVLERQYNIRIPGFATDEVRTVRKQQPGTGYYQKVGAVHAAKLMGGKPDA